MARKKELMANDDAPAGIGAYILAAPLGVSSIARGEVSFQVVDGKVATDSAEASAWLVDAGFLLLKKD